MQLRYFPTKSLHASCGSEDVENNMHSSRFCFSSVQTQQGYNKVSRMQRDGSGDEVYLVLRLCFVLRFEIGREIVRLH